MQLPTPSPGYALIFLAGVMPRPTISWRFVAAALLAAGIALIDAGVTL